MLALYVSCPCDLSSSSVASPASFLVVSLMLFYVLWSRCTGTWGMILECKVLCFEWSWNVYICIINITYILLYTYILLFFSFNFALQCVGIWLATSIGIFACQEWFRQSSAFFNKQKFEVKKDIFPETCLSCWSWTAESPNIATTVLYIPHC